MLPITSTAGMALGYTSLDPKKSCSRAVPLTGKIASGSVYQQSQSQGEGVEGF